ncbi:MAG: helix-turn-helix transcriptional regulator [Candidatus Nitrohelix vancouverensis]|uniref:Helix-turn-helix transcriptional regulator n=1 Tax=Candidatus Nitrohelix vancouverensis TaxID=2705534 RepID=A0A7T0C153_9BACT|nr:MAG: helix-turn-helix transcriptional regulator [Candidatus Nitrohelix vancouverensis]
MQEKKLGTAKFLGERIRQWRKSLPLKSYELAKLINISQGSLSDIENNKSLPSADTIAKLYKYTNINIIWLLTGQGAMKKGKQGAETTEDSGVEAMEPYGQDQTLKELIEKVVRIYHRGNADKKAHLKGFLMGADPGE